MGNCCANSQENESNINRSVLGTTATSSVTSSFFDSEKFVILKLLGKGSFGKVFLVSKKDSGKHFAMKVLKKSEIEQKKQRNNTLTERLALEKMQCPFIVHLRYAFQNSSKVYILMDFVAGGELFRHLKQERKFSEEKAKFYAAEILLALEYMHSKNIIYRDLKPENILLDQEGHIKIADLGLCKTCSSDQEKAYTLCGTPEYIAPEIIKNSGYDKAVDYWSFGTLIYEMIHGSPPFYSVNREEMYHKMLNKPIEVPFDLSAQATDLIKNLLRVNPEERLTDPSKIKSHPFFRSIPWNLLAKKQVKTPYKPRLSSEEDVRHFDAQFTQASACDSLSQSTNPNIYYSNFTFEEEHLGSHNLN